PPMTRSWQRPAHRGPSPDRRLRGLRGAHGDDGHADRGARAGWAHELRVGVQRLHAHQRRRHRGGRRAHGSPWSTRPPGRRAGALRARSPGGRALSGLPPPRAGGASKRMSSPIGPAVLLAAGSVVVLLGLAARALTAVLGLATLGAVMALPGIRRVMPEGTLRARAGIPATI